MNEEKDIKLWKNAQKLMCHPLYALENPRIFQRILEFFKCRKKLKNRQNIPGFLANSNFE